MKTCLSAKRLIQLMLAALASFPSLNAHSQTPTTVALAETVVTATRTEQPLQDLVADVTVVDRDEIERSGATSLTDVLVRMPGIEMARNGGPGTSTSLYLRGAETRFTAVYIDGVRVDSQSTGGAPWEAIPLAQIDRVEILRGPAGAVYGSDALGGVIQIFTRKGQGGFAPYAGVGLGTYGTRKWETGFSGAGESFDYSLGVAREASSGFNTRPVTGYNPDDDGYAVESLSGRLGWQLSRAHRLEATVLASSMDAQYDASNRSPASTKDDHALNLLQTKGLSWRGQWSDSYSTLLSATESRVQYETKPSAYLTMTRLNGYLFQNELRLGAHQLTAALERKVDHLENSPINRDRSQDAVALGYGWRERQHSLQVNWRHDQDSEFGGQDSGSAAYGFALTPLWRATASAGTAFRAPTLYQRFSSYGVSTLQPESSTNQELGLRYAQGSSQFGIVVYRSQVSNLITYSTTATGCVNSPNGCYGNTAQAEYTGLTVSGQYRYADVNLKASLDLQNPRDTQTDKLLARRASHHANLSADTRLGRWLVGGGVQLSGARYDTADNTTVLPGYAVANLYASTKIDKDWSVLARIDNLTDSAYQLASGYATSGRSLYVALKWAPLR